MPEDYEWPGGSAFEGMLAFAQALDNAAQYVLSEPFRSTSIEGPTIAMFMERNPEGVGRMIRLALDGVHNAEIGQGDRLTVVISEEPEGFTITSLPIESVSDHSLN